MNLVRFIYTHSTIINKSIFLQAFLESIGIIILCIVAFIILIFEIKSRRDLRLTYSNITTLQSQTQTTSVLAQIESQYNDLNNYGYNWLYHFRSLIIINSMMMCLFISD